MTDPIQTAPERSQRSIPLARPDIGSRELELVTQVLRSDVPSPWAGSPAVRGRDRRRRRPPRGHRLLERDRRAASWRPCARNQGRRRSPHHALQLRGIRELPALRTGRAAVHRHRGRDPGTRPGVCSRLPQAGAHAPSSRSTCSGVRAGSSTSSPSPGAMAGRSSRTPARHSGRRSAAVPSAASVTCRLRLLPEQADHHRRGRHGRDRRPGAGRRHEASLRNQGRDTDGTWLRHVRLGYNYRLDEMSAAVGVAQLERLADCGKAGRSRRRLRTRLGGSTGSGSPPPAPTMSWTGSSMSSVSIAESIAITSWRRWAGAGRSRRVPTSVRSTCNRSTARRFGFRPGDFPVTERVAATTLALPFSSLMSDDDVAYVADALVDAVAASPGG